MIKEMSNQKNKICLKFRGIFNNLEVKQKTYRCHLENALFILKNNNRKKHPIVLKMDPNCIKFSLMLKHFSFVYKMKNTFWKRFSYLQNEKDVFKAFFRFYKMKENTFLNRFSSVYKMKNTFCKPFLF